VVFREFGGPVAIEEVPEPEAAEGGVVLRVEATGLCRSDWHGWRGHDPDIALPHVPGHELAGTITRVGTGVRRWRGGERVTVAFVGSCGRCPSCLAGEGQVCDDQRQPGFHYWGSFADLVSIERADVNVVALPNALDMVTAASLGCRFGTAYRAVTKQGRVAPGEWVAIHGCGGVGLSAVMIAAAAGARVVAIDVSERALEAARELGAEVAIAAGSGAEAGDVVQQVLEATDGGAHLSIDALGSTATALKSIASLRKRGRHVQVGLMVGDDATSPIPMNTVMARELELVGSHGLAARDYPAMLDRIASGELQPGRLVGRTISLEEAPAALVAMDRPSTGAGMTVIVP
jgi:D-arabinose 1-dehydrogenase-like Zn-dependent alcohol dehydrogenase